MATAEEYARLCQQFQQWCQACDHELHKICAPGQMPTEAQMQQLAANCSSFRDQTLLRFGPTAESYRQQSLPFLSEQLTHYRDQLAEMAKIYNQMVQDNRVSRAERQSLQLRADAEIAAMHQQTLNYSRQLRDDSQRRFMQANFGGNPGYCPHCSRGYQGSRCSWCYP